MMIRQFAVQPPGSAQACEVGSGVVKVGSSYDSNTGSVPVPPPSHGSVKTTLTLGVAAAVGVEPQFQPTSASAMVAPGQVVYEPCVPGNGPVDVDPLQAEAKVPGRPCE